MILGETVGETSACNGIRTIIDTWRPWIFPPYFPEDRGPILGGGHVVPSSLHRGIQEEEDDNNSFSVLSAR